MSTLADELHQMELRAEAAEEARDRLAAALNFQRARAKAAENRVVVLQAMADSLAGKHDTRFPPGFARGPKGG